MAVNISCPSCRRLLQLPGRYEGQEVRCPECQTTFVPARAEGITTIPPPPTPIAEAAVLPGLPPVGPTLPRFTAPDELEIGDPFLKNELTEFRSLRPLGLVVKLLLGCDMGLSLMLLASNVIHYRLVTRFQAGVPVPDALWDRLETWQTILGVVHFLFYVVTAIVFIIWFHRAYLNLKPLTAHPLQHPSAWAIGGWFVPFLNLVRPVQIAQEIWRGSDPDAAVPGEFAHPASPNSALIGFWWAVWLINNIISHFAMRMSLDARNAEAILSATVANIIAGIGTVIAAALAFAVVARISSRQTQRFEALRGGISSPDHEQWRD